MRAANSQLICIPAANGASNPATIIIGAILCINRARLGWFGKMARIIGRVTASTRVAVTDKTPHLRAVFVEASVNN